MKDLSEARILIVDDVKANVDVLVQALKEEYRLSVALNGETALRVAQRTPPDLILLDVMMPGMDGYEVCRRVRSDPVTRDTPVIFLTALDEVQSKLAGFEAGGTDYVTKPFEILEVKARVRSLLQAKAYREAAQELVTRDLRIAREIQLGMVLTDFSYFTGTPADIHGLLAPARDVGGDLFSVFPLDENRICFAIGDVSGKGVPAALYMAIATALLRTLARDGPSPERILQRLNNELIEGGGKTGLFVTVLCGILSLDSGHITWASGGHMPPILCGPGRPPFLANDVLGPVLGVWGDQSFERAETVLSPGDVFLMYTDGVTEAVDGNKVLFGDERLMSYVSSANVSSARGLTEGLLKCVRGFAAGAPQSDDIAILAIRYQPQV